MSAPHRDRRHRYTPNPLTIAHAIAGYRPPLTPRERRAAIAHLRATGLSYTAAAAHLGCTPRTIARHVAALRKEGTQ